VPLELFPIASTQYESDDVIRKEANVGYKPPTRGPSEWPSIVFEVGVSQSLNSLHAAADIWLTKSHGNAHVVIVVSVNTTDRSLLIEHWEPIVPPLPTAMILRSISRWATIERT
jgi:hypothetical protein